MKGTHHITHQERLTELLPLINELQTRLQGTKEEFTGELNPDYDTPPRPADEILDEIFRTAGAPWTVEVEMTERGSYAVPLGSEVPPSTRFPRPKEG